MIHLSEATLPALARRLEVPAYDRRQLRPSIVHIGVGGFHRAHQAVYLDALASDGVTCWGETGVGLRSPRMRSALATQDCLFTVVERGSEGDRARVVGAMGSFLYAPDDPEAVLSRLVDSDTRIVSLTITGDGYNLDAQGQFREDDPSVARELRANDSPQAWFGYVTTALARRRAAGSPGFTVLSCDNLPNSGEAARSALVSYAGLRDETLAAWIERNVSFPNAMVDRITPGADPGLKTFVASRFGVIDQVPVATEPFTQWVVEDNFCQGRPALDAVGVQFVADVAPHKLVKTRLLNGTHSAMAYLGYLAGYRTTAEMMADPTMRAFVTKLMRDEIAPLLPHVPGLDLTAYVDALLQRLGNPSIGDPLARLCGRGSTKVPAYLLPSLIEARRRGRRAPLLTLAVAGWFRYLRGLDLSGAPIPIDDARIDELRPLALRGQCDPALLLGCRSVMGALSYDLTARREIHADLIDIEKGLMATVASRLHAETAEVLSLDPPQPRNSADVETDLIS